jgi:hypothetical protein
MKPSAPLFLLALTLAVSLPGQPGNDRFGGTKAKIEALLNPRLKPEPLPDKPANPFQFTLPGSVIAAPIDPGPTQPVPSTLSDDDQILAFSVARLRITGLVLRNGIAHLLINSATYKESDLVPVRAGGDLVYYIRIARITESRVTFVDNDASMVVPLPN